MIARSDDLAVGSVPEGAGAASGTCSPPDQTPLTNRGSLNPYPHVTCHVDYCKQTVWAPLDRVLFTLENSIIDEHWASRHEKWVPSQGKRGLIYTGADGLIQVVTYVHGGVDRDYLSVEVKGQGCSCLGIDGVQSLVRNLHGIGRVNASRIDVAWDGFPLDPLQVLGLLNRRRYRSRSTLDPHFVGNPDQPGTRTVYTHSKPEKRGIDRYVRWYDLRGPTRLELVLHGDPASVFSSWILRDSPADQFPALALGGLRDFIEFVADDDSRSFDRASLHPAWESFAGEAERLRLRPPARSELDPSDAERCFLGKYEGAMERFARAALEYSMAFGEEQLIARLREKMFRALPEPSNVDILRRYRDYWAMNGMGGLPVAPESYNRDDIPF